MNTTYQITKNAYSIWVEAISTIDDKTSLHFKTQWWDAKSRDGLHNKFQMILSKDEIGRLIEVLTIEKDKQ